MRVLEGEKTAQLISYSRPDVSGPKRSDFSVARTEVFYSDRMGSSIHLAFMCSETVDVHMSTTSGPEKKKRPLYESAFDGLLYFDLRKI